MGQQKRPLPAPMMTFWDGCWINQEKNGKFQTVPFSCWEDLCRLCPSKAGCALQRMQTLNLYTAHVSIHLCCKLKLLRIECACSNSCTALSVWLMHDTRLMVCWKPNKNNVGGGDKGSTTLVRGSTAATYLPFDSSFKTTTALCDLRGHNGSFPEFSEAHTPAASLFLLHLGYSFPTRLSHNRRLFRSLADNYFSIPSWRCCHRHFLNYILKEQSIGQSDDELDLKIKQQKKNVCNPLLNH